MTDQEFLELFSQSTTALLEETVKDLLAENERYQQILEQEELVEQQYLLMDLTEEQRGVIDEMLLLKEHNALHYADACYLAGIRNTLQLYKALKI